MFLDFALLTEQQGELLDQIEFQVKSAGDYIEQANEEVVEAIEISKKVRKKQWYVHFIVIPGKCPVEMFSKSTLSLPPFFIILTIYMLVVCLLCLLVFFF
jgi:hypothetical protein